MTYNMTLNLGSGKEGEERRATYDRAARQSGARSLNEWVKTVLDKAARAAQKTGS